MVLSSGSRRPALLSALDWQSSLWLVEAYIEAISAIDAVVINVKIHVAI
jgi:hypothetical protein